MNCTIQFVWENPPWISSTSGVRDKIILQVLDNEKFMDPDRRLLESVHGVIMRLDGKWEIMMPP